MPGGGNGFVKNSGFEWVAKNSVTLSKRADLRAREKGSLSKLSCVVSISLCYIAVVISWLRLNT